MVNLRLPWLQEQFSQGNIETQERILDALVVVKLFQTLKHVINVNSQKSFTGLWSDARASLSLFLFCFWRWIVDVFSQAYLSINYDHLYSAANMRWERVRAPMREFSFWATVIVPPWESVPYAICILCVLYIYISDTIIVLIIVLSKKNSIFHFKHFCCVYMSIFEFTFFPF